MKRFAVNSGKATGFKLALKKQTENQMGKIMQKAMLKDESEKMQRQESAKKYMNKSMEQKN